MKSFLEFKYDSEINENRAGIYVSSAVLVSRIKRLADRIRNEKDMDKKIMYISQQNRWLAVMNGVNFSLMQNK